MPQSRHWKELQVAVERLRLHFLPNPFDPLGNYSSPLRVQAHTRAFLVLSHAEIETFIEDWAKRIARSSEVCWSKSKKVTAPLAFLIASSAKRIESPKSLGGGIQKDSSQQFSDEVPRVFERFYKQIKGNHGVKEPDVLALLGSIGVPSTSFAPTLLPNLNSLGSLRGEHAHRAAKAVQNVLDPETEYLRVVNVVGDLSSLDAWLFDLNRRIR